MSLAYIVKFRVNRATYERLLQEAATVKAGTVSAYLRNRVFGPAMFMETMLKENNTLLKEIKKEVQKITRETIK